LSTPQEALAVNLDPKPYGTFAEIGGGQEVARWFFRVGGAAGTMAKAISAYDMAVSDTLYGPAQRYVSRQRLEAMLAHEFQEKGASQCSASARSNLRERKTKSAVLVLCSNRSRRSPIKPKDRRWNLRILLRMVGMGCVCWGWFSPHNPKVAGSNPAPATKEDRQISNPGPQTLGFAFSIGFRLRKVTPSPGRCDVSLVPSRR
jgi:hypothetical protein